MLALGWAPSSAPAHPEHVAGELLHAVSLAEARKLAEQESKIICAYVIGPNGQVPSYLKSPTWQEWQTLDLLLRETVAVKLDSKRDADELRRYELEELPAVLLLNPDGTERRRLPGDMSIEQLMQQLAEDLSAADSVARARQAVAKRGGEDPLSRERLAAALVRHGAFPEALKEYLWCLDVGLRRDVRYAAARRRYVLEGFVALAERYPEARHALKNRRAAMEQALRGDRDDANLARDWATLNSCLNDETRTLALFDTLPQKSRARHILFDRLLDRLIAQQRYDEVLAIVDPMEAFGQEITLARMRGNRFGEGPGAEQVRGTRAFAVARGAAFVEGLAGVGRGEEALALAKRILAYQNTPETWALLNRHAQRVRSQELLDYLETAAPAPLVGDAP